MKPTKVLVVTKAKPPTSEDEADWQLPLEFSISSRPRLSLEQANEQKKGFQFSFPLIASFPIRLKRKTADKTGQVSVTTLSVWSICKYAKLGRYRLRKSVFPFFIVAP